MRSPEIIRLNGAAGAEAAERSGAVRCGAERSGGRAASGLHPLYLLLCIVSPGNADKLICWLLPRFDFQLFDPDLLQLGPEDAELRPEGPPGGPRSGPGRHLTPDL